jgi:hypothetical protein
VTIVRIRVEGPLDAAPKAVIALVNEIEARGHKFLLKDTEAMETGTGWVAVEVTDEDRSAAKAEVEDTIRAVPGADGVLTVADD